MPPRAPSRDAYAVLGVPYGASLADIKRAYRRLAAALHPDHHPDDPGRVAAFREAAAAYRELTRPPPPIRRAQAEAQLEPDRDLRTRLRVDLEDLLEGATYRLRLALTRGRSRARQHRTLEVRVPPGLETGTLLRLRGQGEVPTRDLLVEVAVRPHPLFERQGQDLRCELPVPLPVALWGGELQVPGLGRTLSVRVPAGARQGQCLRLRGQGLPSRDGRGPRGELRLELRLELPRGMSPREQERLAAALAALPAERYPRYTRLLQSLRGP